VVDHIAVKGLDATLLSYPVSSLTIPTLGFATEDMAAAIDPLVANYMNQNGSAGGTVTITYNNHLIFAKSYGYADVSNGLFTQPDSRLRIASVTKALTAMGILKLAHDSIPLLGSAPGWPLNYHPFNPPAFGSPIGGSTQTWIEPATVSDLLYHEGGWAEDYEDYDTLKAVEGVLGTGGPPDCQTLLRYVQAQPMTSADFSPGNGQIYSNIGFCALGETIRQLSGAASYMDYMNTNVFAPLGMNDTLLGSSKQADQLDREVVYYPCGYLAGRYAPKSPIPCEYGTPPIEGKSLFPPHDTVSVAYGGGVHTFSLQASEGAGGLVSTSIDLARFSGAIASGQLPNFQGDLLHPGWPKKFYTYSAGQSAYEKAKGLNDIYMGMGWNWVQPKPVATPFLPYDNYNLEKIGQLPGTSSSVTTTGDGYSFSGIFNGDFGSGTVAPAEGIFWGKAGAPQAAYNHASAQPWYVDFYPNTHRIIPPGCHPATSRRIWPRRRAADFIHRAWKGEPPPPAPLHFPRCSSSTEPDSAPRNFQRVRRRRRCSMAHRVRPSSARFKPLRHRRLWSACRYSSTRTLFHLFTRLCGRGPSLSSPGAKINDALAMSSARPRTLRKSLPVVRAGVGRYLGTKHDRRPHDCPRETRESGGGLFGNGLPTVPLRYRTAA